MTDGGHLTVGVEEEFLLVDAETGRLRPKADDILPDAGTRPSGDIEPELQLSQLETATEVCSTLTEVRRELIRLRRRVIQAAGEAGYRIGATGTHPFSHWTENRVTPKDRYLWAEDRFQQLVRDMTVCGCHIHVGMPDPEATIQVMNRVRPWLPVLLALSSNSPFWTGSDTGYHSFRTIMAHRTPVSGIPDVLASRADYDELVDQLIGTGIIDSPASIWWDVRPSDRFPTLEFRVTDVCLTVDEAVMVAGLVRGLAKTCLGQWRNGDATPAVRPQIVRVASWQAARYGTGADLIDPFAARPVPAPRLVAGLLDFARPALEDAGDWDEIQGLVGGTLARGTGAARQRRAFERNGRVEDAVELIVAETAAELAQTSA